MILDVRGAADPVTQVGKREDGAEHFRLERRADVGVHRGALSQDPAQVEHLDGVAHADVAGHHAGIAAERAPGAEGPGEHISAAQLQHPPGDVLDRVVGRFVLQDPDREHVAFAGQDLVTHDDLGRERRVAGGRGDTIQSDTSGNDHLILLRVLQQLHHEDTKNTKVTDALRFITPSSDYRSSSCFCFSFSYFQPTVTGCCDLAWPLRRPSCSSWSLCGEAPGSSCLPL